MYPFCTANLAGRYEIFVYPIAYSYKFFREVVPPPPTKWLKEFEPTNGLKSGNQPTNHRIDLNLLVD